ncbi:LysR family transcriptional regulator [Leucobacter sp. UT-8R-CII-1-4]|uniref:LysR family transcriptional regulator n=1 Tax=Leucobacter sp. UT-8R-CII-1-4 TaxID=3040075 RepID=UPI0024A80920|nr:LysR family transcriptional regulator [Leucobacter sp. UT-8R-CII-1-4]MDI6022400.1 LysR family transcriptional regulator [Leucobacter sp. UT-8R-CII-1-4]
MDVSLSQLRAFVAVLDRGSFTEAAAQLQMSQSAISHAIAGLERVVGGPVIRRGSGVSLTNVGSQILPHARAALASIEAMESALRPDDALTGVVRLGAVPTVYQGLVPELLANWAARLPGVAVQIYEGDDDEMLEWVEAGVVDAAILTEPRNASPDGKLIATDEFCAVLRKDHPLAELEAIPLAEMLEDGLIVSTGGCEGEVNRMYAEEQLSFRYSHRVREISTLFHMVGQGLGVAIVPSLGRAMLPDTLTMKPLSPSQPRRLVLSGPSSRPWHPLARALVETVAVDKTTTQKVGASV